MTMFYKRMQPVSATGTPPAVPADHPGFERHLHLFRGIAISLIVMLHSVPSFDWSAWPMISAILAAALQQSSMLFFFISGYLFQHLSGRFHYRSYLKRKAEIVILPYLVMSVPALVVALFFIPEESVWSWFYDLPLWQQAGLLLLTGKHLEPLWFVPAISLFYLAAPFLLAADRTPRLYLGLPALVVLAAFLGPDGPTGPLQKAVYLLPAYVFGMFVSRYRDAVEKFTEASLVWASIGLALLFIAIVAADANPPGDLIMLLRLGSCPIMLLVLKRYESSLPRSLGTIASLSFGIYFVHGYLLAGFRLLYTIASGHRWIGNSSLFPGSLIGLLVHACVALGLSAAIVATVKRLAPRYSRRIVGS